MIEVRDAKKWIQNGARRVEILKGITLTIPAGQFVAIVGASGSGKSTLLGLLAGLDTPSSGEIFLDGVPIHNLAETELAAVRGEKIGFVFQSYQLIETLTALENVLLPYELNVEGSGIAQARRLLDEVGLTERVDHYPVQLSGGEQQRVALARAFVVAPPIVMADEPTGNLDSTNGRMVLDLLLERNRKAGTTLVLVTHDPEVASQADRKIVLRDGMIVEDTLPYTGPSAVAIQDQEKNGLARVELEASRGHWLARSALCSRQIRFCGAVSSRGRGGSGWRARLQRELPADAEHGSAVADGRRSDRAALPSADSRGKGQDCGHRATGRNSHHLGDRDGFHGFRAARSGASAGFTQGR